MPKLTEKDCLLEIEKNVRFLLQYKTDKEFVKQIYTTLRCATTKLDKIREQKARLKEARDADKYAKDMGLRKV